MSNEIIIKLIYLTQLHLHKVWQWSSPLLKQHLQRLSPSMVSLSL